MDSAQGTFMGHGAYHWKDGWYFKRLDNGDVEIDVRDVSAGLGNKVVARAVIPAAEWVSIVAGVAQNAHHSMTYSLATWLHNAMPHDYVLQKDVVETLRAY